MDETGYYDMIKKILIEKKREKISYMLKNKRIKKITSP